MATQPNIWSTGSFDYCVAVGTPVVAINWEWASLNWDNISLSQQTWDTTYGYCDYIAVIEYRKGGPGAPSSTTSMKYRNEQELILLEQISTYRGVKDIYVGLKFIDKLYDSTQRNLINKSRVYERYSETLKNFPMRILAENHNPLYKKASVSKLKIGNKNVL